MDQRFQSIIEAAVQIAKAEKSLLWADDVAERIASSTPLSVRAADISEQISREAARWEFRSPSRSGGRHSEARVARELPRNSARPA